MLTSYVARAGPHVGQILGEYKMFSNWTLALRERAIHDVEDMDKLTQT
jgi:hypothetical protein